MYAQIQRQADRHSIAELCSIYGVSRSGYYKWKKRNGNINRYEQAQQALDTLVSDIHAHYPMMGYRSVRDVLALQFGLHVSDPSVWKSMRRLQIYGYTRRRKVPCSGSGMQHTRYPNWLKRNFHADMPMQKVVTDVTYLRFHGSWYYLAAYLDLYNNEILEWELSSTFDNFLVIRPAERLLKRTESTTHQILFHSDQGVQYSSAGYCNLLTRYNVLQSMSRAGTPHDNAVMESFWGRFKDTLRKHFRYWEKDDLYSVVDECIHYFNYCRPLRKLNGKPPVLFRSELVA